MDMKPRDLTGQRFGRLVAIKPTNERYHSLIVWLFQCDCGKVIKKGSCSITLNGISSCGCFRKERARSLRKESHGSSNTKKWYLWMKIRRHGVVEQWNDFLIFDRDIEIVPDALLCRIHPEQPYGPSNFEWDFIPTSKAQLSRKQRKQWHQITELRNVLQELTNSSLTKSFVKPKLMRTLPVIEA